MTKEYNALDEQQRAFYTIALLLAEIESQATKNKLYTEKDIPEPGEEGYVEPKLG
jgi:hypothetical protein